MRRIFPKNSMPAKKFHIVFEIKPAVRVKDGTPFTFNFPRPSGEIDTLVVGELWQQFDGAKIANGLQIRADVLSESSDEAINQAISLADGLASFVTLATAVALPEPKPIIVMEATDDQPKREFLQFFYDAPISKSSRGELDPKRIVELMEGFL